MVDRRQRVLLATVALAATLAANSPSFAEDGAMVAAPPTPSSAGWLESEPLDPLEQSRREVTLDDIDDENFRVGVYGGLLSVQDFGVESVEGVTGAYHVTEDIYLEGVFFRSQLGLTSYERLSGSARLLADDDRELTYYGVNVGIDILPGESYVGPWAVVNSAVYLVGGVGSTDFGGDERFTMTMGVGYRVLATDWFALHIDVRDHLFESDLLGEDETLHNFEVRSGFTIFF